MQRIAFYLMATFAGMSFLATLAIAGNSSITLPVGTQLDVELTTTVSSKANQNGDPFLAQIETPVFAGGQEVIPAGSTLRGHIAFVKPAGRAKGKAEMRLVADNVVTKDGKREFSFKGGLASLASDSGVKKKDNEGTLEGASKDSKKDAEDAGIATAAGAGIGAMTAGGAGALYGAAIGAGAGLIYLIAKHHKPIVLNAGTELTFQLTTQGVESVAAKNTPISAPFICTTCQ
jgi:hypothetical protein